MSEHEQSPQALAQDVEQTRAEIGHTLDAIRYKLSLGQFLDQAIARLRSGPGPGTGSYLGDTLPRNPLPAIMIGVGLGWLAWNHYQRSRPAAPGFREDLPDLGEHKEPLRLGGLGLVAGAAVGSLLAPTRVEDEWLGERRDQVLDQARATGEDYGSRARRVAEAGRRAAEAEMDRQGQQAPEEKASLESTGKRIVDIPKAALGGAGEEAERQHRGSPEEPPKS